MVNKEYVDDLPVQCRDFVDLELESGEWISAEERLKASISWD